jgi:hypothetical protein
MRFAAIKEGKKLQAGMQQAQIRAKLGGHLECKSLAYMALEKIAPNRPKKNLPRTLSPLLRIAALIALPAD